MMSFSTLDKSLIGMIVFSIVVASRIKLKPSVDEQRLATLELGPSHNPIAPGQAKDVSRLRRVLDSLAILCVHWEKGQVIAIGLRLTGGVVEFLIAENHVDGTKNITHLNTIWSLLQKLSQRYAIYHGALKPSKSPPQPKHRDLDSETRKLEDDLTLEALMHTQEKLKRRFYKHDERFQSFKVEIGHPYFKV